MFGPSCSLGFGRTVVITWVVGIYVSFPPVRFLLTGSDGTLATSKTAPAEKSGLSAGPENGGLSVGRERKVSQRDLRMEDFDP